jgi:type IV pilus assembly protein PilY1
LPTIKDSGQPDQIAKMANGKWAVVLGNGYNSSSGSAALFVVFLDGPDGAGTWTQNTHYVKLVRDTRRKRLIDSMPFDSDAMAKSMWYMPAI